MYNFSIGTIFLITVLIIITVACRALTRRSIGVCIYKIDTWIVAGLILRIIWAFIVVWLESKMSFLVYDDETYYKFAAFDIGQALNGYNVFLHWLYWVFGKSSLNGRIVNITLSLLTIYPLASIENNLNDETSFMAAKFCALSPFMVFISFFEIKDIILMFSFTASYALIKEYIKTRNKWIIVLLIILGFVGEQIRTSMGVIPIAVLLVSIIVQGFGKTRRQRIFSSVIVLAIIVGCGLYIGQGYINDASLKVENYQTWIFTQFSESSIYNWFVITKLTDIWKLPFCFVLYALQPLNALDGSGRFFMEWGMLAKILDVPVLLMSMWWLPQYIKKEKLYAILFILPYAFVSGINLTNARQGFFLYPIMYLICFHGYEMSGCYEGNSKILATLNQRKFSQLMFMGLYGLWFVFVMRRVV